MNEILLGSVLVADLTDPQPHEVDLPFMQQRLESIRRFSGHPLALTVDEHQRVTRALAQRSDAPEAVIVWAGLHDAHEYALGDTVTPIKRMLGGWLVPIERAWDRAIAAALGVPEPGEDVRAAVAEFDRLALLLEWQWCLGRAPAELGVDHDGMAEAVAGEVLTLALGEWRAFAAFDARRRAAGVAA